MDQTQQQQTPEQVKQQRDAVAESVNRNLMRMHMFRRQYDQKRAYLYRQYLSQRDQQIFPDNVTKRSNTFVPYPHTSVEAVVSRTDDALFSNYPFFETRGRGENDDVRAEKMQQVLEYMLQKANFKAAMESLVRTIAIYGHGGIKVDWDWDYDVLQGLEPITAKQIIPVIDPQTGQPAMQNGQLVPQVDGHGQPILIDMIDPTTGNPIIVGQQMVTKPVPRMRPKFIPIDTYDLLVDPDGGMIATMCERTLPELKREAEVNPQLYYPEALQELETQLTKEKDYDQIIIRIAEFWNKIDGTCTVMTFAHDKEAISWKDLRASFRYASYTGFRRRMYGGKPIVLWSGPNQFAHKQAPILCTSYIKLPNEAYGLGIVETISDLSESLNKMTNMVVDNWNLGINRRYAYDVNADIDHVALNSANVPGGKVGVSGNPQEVLFPLPFYTPGASDYQVLEIYKDMIQMTSGVSDFYGKGVGSSGGNRTATGIQQVIGESNYKFKMFIRNLELDVVVPLLEMCSSMVQQFCTDEVEYMITDTAPGIPKYGRVKLEEMVGNFDFVCAAANYATNKVIRQRNMMALAQVVGESGYLQERPALVELAKNFDIPHAQRFIKSDQQVQQEQQAQMQQQVQARNEEWAHEEKMLILQYLLQTESKARLEQSKPRVSGGGQGAGGGRPRRFMQPEGPIRGAGLTSAIKSVAQGLGANGLGLEGMGEVNGG